VPRRLVVPVLLLAACACAAIAFAQSRRPDPSTMAAYVVGIYTRGPKWTPGRTPYSDSIQAGHLENMRRMAATGILIGAGPFKNDTRTRGLLIFRDFPPETIQRMVKMDPALQTQRLLIELHRWYAPRGIGDAYAARAKLRPQNPDSMILMPVVLLQKPTYAAQPDSVSLARATAGHMGHILDLMLSGQMLAGGPFFEPGPIRGICFFGTDTTTALKLSLDDPAVKAGRLEVQMLPWYTAWGVMPPTPTIKELRQ
jgi:uncharacterized protein YciI